MSDELLADLARAVAAPSTLASKRGVSLHDFASEAASPENRAAMDSLRAIADAQAALVISRSRARAARRLLRIAMSREAPETARKACVDLLGMGTDGAAPRLVTGADDTSWRDEVRAMLEGSGRSDSGEAL